MEDLQIKARNQQKDEENFPHKSSTVKIAAAADRLVQRHARGLPARLRTHKPSGMAYKPLL